MKRGLFARKDGLDGQVEAVELVCLGADLVALLLEDRVQHQQKLAHQVERAD